MKAVAKIVPGMLEHDDEDTIINRLISHLAAVPFDKEPTDLQLARIADCIERNTRVARALQT